MLAEVPQVVYNNFRCEIESHCVGGRIACAGYGELALPIAAVLFLFLPKTTKYHTSSAYFRYGVRSSFFIIQFFKPKINIFFNIIEHGMLNHWNLNLL